MAQLHLHLMERNPKRLRIALRPFTSRQLLLRAAVGLLLLILGSQFWGRSLLFGLISIGAGLGIGIPWGLGHTLSLDRVSQKVSFTRHRGPWGVWRQRVFSYPLAQLQTVHVYRTGREVLDNQAQDSFQVQSQVRLRFHQEEFEQEADPNQVREEAIAHFTSQSGVKGTEPEAFVLSERLVRWIQPYLPPQ
ncbi:hypothetical protein L1047_16405 [Synechococcus sp. Nb3U1]|uniref:hypothetical protein n=1 Tax=Synechococcus sp. Nb3U1 TaxID=1914529 RepID=UPI001F452559|nr:hypothetical protein [Synechococcus sp. Nb3U1]MCF2972776.1 hypothetical protein [Synechococcus sp. Nb3U1]